MANQISRMDVQFSAFPSGFCPANFNELGQALAQRLIVTPGLGFTGVNVGPVAPDNTDIPWFNTTVNDWYYYSTVTGSWIPVDPTTVVGEVAVGTVLGWDGQISQIASVWGDRWLFANGDLLSVTDYPDYFAQIGTKWGGDGITTFGMVDGRDRFWVGAAVDDSGQAKTQVSDGAALTIQRAYMEHKHARNGGDAATGSGDGIPASGNSYSTTELDIASDTVSQIPIRVLPPYYALVPIVRVK